MQKQAELLLSTAWGSFQTVTYANSARRSYLPFVLIHPELNPAQPVHVGIHYECVVGDVFGSDHCDCGERLDATMSIIAAEKGIAIYLRLARQRVSWLDTWRSNSTPSRVDYTSTCSPPLTSGTASQIYPSVIQILQDLGLNEIYLLTNDPLATKAIAQSPLKLVSWVPIIIPAV